MARRKYTLEFKQSAVQLVNLQGYSIPEAARNLGVDVHTLRDWVKKFSGPDGASAGEGGMAAELRRLRKENARLRLEREILKKAAAFFAKEHS